MRKSYVFSMAIILIALVGMMVAAEMALKPMKRSMAVAKDLTALLEARGDIEPGSKVVVITLKAEERHLAEEGYGMILELEPSEAVRSRKGRLAKLARRAVAEAGRLHKQGKGKPLAWFEVRFGDSKEPWHRSLYTVGKAGEILRPQPAIPPVHIAAAR